MNVVRTLVRVHHFEVDEVTRDAEIIADTVTAHHVTRSARNVERLTAAVALHDRGDFGGRRALVLQAPEPQAALQSERDLGPHISEFFLDELVGSQRTAELLAVNHILPRSQITVLGSAERSPRNAVPCAV